MNLINENTVLLWTPQTGIFVREDGVLKYIRTGYDTSPDSSGNYPSNNLDGSETASQQPRLVGGIAPGSKVAAANLGGEVRRFTHPTISYGAGEAWSLSFIINSNGSIAGKSQRVIGKNSSTNSNIFFSVGGDFTIRFRNDSGNLITILLNNSSYIGKSTIYTMVANGSGNLAFFIDGVKVNDFTIATNFVFQELLRSNVDNINGSALFYKIQSGALTPTQVADLHTTLIGLYPEIESVDIGAETVASRNFEAVASTDRTVIADGNTTANWTQGTAAWCYHNGATPDTPNPDNGAVYGKLYNKAARNVIVANPPSGWHVATEAELTALATLGGNALRYSGTDYWATTGGTNTTGFTALGGSSRNADGSFNTIKETASFWCADSDKVLLLNHNDNTATIVAATANQGHSIRLIKD